MDFLVHMKKRNNKIFRGIDRDSKNILQFVETSWKEAQLPSENNGIQGSLSLSILEQTQVVTSRVG